MAGHNGWKTVHFKTPFIPAQAGIQTSTSIALGPRCSLPPRRRGRGRTELVQQLCSVMAALVAAIHVLLVATRRSRRLGPRFRGDEREALGQRNSHKTLQRTKKVVDARHKDGHDAPTQPGCR